MKIPQEDIYNIIIGRTSIVVSRALLRNFRKRNITITMDQWSLLAILWKKDGCNQLELCKRSFREKTTLSRQLDKMEQENFIVRVPDRQDRRIRFIYLTAKGKSLEGLANQVVEETYLQAIEGLSDEELQVTKTVLKRIVDNLSNTI